MNFISRESQCFPRQSDLLYSKANGSNRWKTNNHVIDKRHATAVNISLVTVNCFLFDVIVFAMLPAHGIWQETVSLLSCDNELANERACCSRKNASSITNVYILNSSLITTCIVAYI